MEVLTHWGRVTHICVSNLTTIGSNNGLSPDRRQAIIWTNARILLIGPLGTNSSEILIEIHTFSFKKMYLKLSSAKWCLFRLGLNVLIWWKSCDIDAPPASDKYIIKMRTFPSWYVLSIFLLSYSAMLCPTHSGAERPCLHAIFLVLCIIGCCPVYIQMSTWESLGCS